MTFYRIAIRTQPSADLRWISTKLTSIHAVSRYLQMFQSSSHRMRAFFASSVDTFDILLARENKGLEHASVSAMQFVGEWQAAVGAHEEKACEAIRQEYQQQDTAATNAASAAGVMRLSP